MLFFHCLGKPKNGYTPTQQHFQVSLQLFQFRTQRHCFSVLHPALLNADGRIKTKNTLWSPVLNFESGARQIHKLIYPTEHLIIRLLHKLSRRIKFTAPT